MALDKSPDDARPYIEKASPRHPSLIDTEHRVAHLYGIINISTVIWIDEAGKIVRPAAIEYGSNIFKQFHGKDAGPHLDAVRHWVKTGEPPMDDADVRSGTVPPTHDEQLARAEFALAWYLHQQGSDRAEPHFERAAKLSPTDWTIRRGSMPIRGQNPMGPEFFELFKEWEASGKPDYVSLAAERS